MLRDKRLQLGDRFSMAEKFKFCRRRDQIIDYDVGVGTTADKLGGAVLATELNASHGSLVERELMGQLESRC